MELDLLFWGLTLGVAGKVLLGVAVVLVHGKIVHEHRIDNYVLSSMRRESKIALIGILLMIIGYALEIAHYGYF